MLYESGYITDLGFSSVFFEVMPPPSVLSDHTKLYAPGAFRFIAEKDETEFILINNLNKSVELRVKRGRHLGWGSGLAMYNGVARM